MRGYRLMLLALMTLFDFVNIGLESLMLAFDKYIEIINKFIHKVCNGNGTWKPSVKTLRSHYEFPSGNRTHTHCDYSRTLVPLRHGGVTILYYAGKSVKLLILFIIFLLIYFLIIIILLLYTLCITVILLSYIFILLT